MPVKINIGNFTSNIDGDLDDLVALELYRRLAYQRNDSFFQAQAVNASSDREWDGWTRLYYPDRRQTFYTGLMTEVTNLFKEAKLDYQINDMRAVAPQNIPWLKFSASSDKEERPYQKQTVDACKTYTRGIVQAATGAGKTFMVTELIGELKTAPFIFLVPSIDLLEQTHDTLSSCLNAPIGLIGDGNSDIQDISVMTMQTAIQSLHSQDKKFDPEAYKYDEDEDCESSLEPSKAEMVKKYIKEANGIYFDECVSGDSILLTDKGFVRIDNVITSGCRYVLSWNGSEPVFKEIKNWWYKGKKITICLTFENGNEIKCTPEHLIYTQNGWIMAGNLQRGDLVLNASAAAGLFLNGINTDISQNTFLDIKSEKEPSMNGNSNMKRLPQKDHYAPVAAAKALTPFSKMLANLSPAMEVKDKISSCSDMISNGFTNDTTLNCPKENSKQLLEQPSEIQASSFLIQDLKTTDSQPITDFCKNNGFCIKPNSYIGSESKQKNLKTLDLERDGSVCGLDACLPFQIYQNSYMKGKQKRYREKPLTPLGILDSLGGFATMEAVQMEEEHSRCIQKGTAKKKILFVKNGSAKKDFPVRFAIQKAAHIFFLTQKELENLKKESPSTSPNVCDTNWVRLSNVEKSPECDLFDIEVEDTHNFFANGILVHNCHHAATKTCEEIMRAAKKAYWRFGGSATPYREDGADLMIQALFGRKLVNITPSYLIDRGFLVRPNIFNVKMDGHFGDFFTYGKIYKHWIVENDPLNKLVATTMKYLENAGVSTLTLVQRYEHGERLQALLPGVPFIRGDMRRKDRKKIILDLKEGRIKSCIATTLADEGLDVKRLGAVLIPGGGKSITRVYQRVGRVLRPFEEDGVKKNHAVAVLFQHDAKFLKDHGNKVRRLMEDEPAFITKNCKPYELLNEISGIVSPQETLFGDL